MPIRGPPAEGRQEHVLHRSSVSDTIADGLQHYPERIYLHGVSNELKRIFSKDVLSVDCLFCHILPTREELALQIQLWSSGKEDFNSAAV